MSLDARLAALAERAKRGPSLGPLYKAVDHLIARGEARDVAFLLREYRALKWPDGRVWVYGHLLDYLPAAPRPEMAETLLHHLIFDAPAPSRQRRAAEMLALGQPREIVERWLEQDLPYAQALPALALLAHTLALAGWEGAGTRLGRSLQQALRGAGHPLGELSLSLHEWERALPRRHYDYRLGKAGGESYAYPGEAAWGPAAPVDGEVRAPTHHLLENPGGLTAPFELWTEDSNAQVEATTVGFGAPVTRLTPHLLCGLSLESAVSPDTLRLHPCTAAEVFSQLFSAGLTGGAYGGALYGAEARLAAWRSLGALVGLPFGGNVEAIAALARRCTFALYFDPGSHFFDDLCMFAVACLRPDGRSLVALAVTDTD